jgi:hypothetical protein
MIMKTFDDNYLHPLHKWPCLIHLCLGTACVKYRGMPHERFRLNRWNDSSDLYYLPQDYVPGKFPKTLLSDYDETPEFDYSHCHCL